MQTYDYPEHTYQPDGIVKCPVVPATRFSTPWDADTRYNATTGRGYSDTLFLSREDWDQTAAKACYHCFTCPAGYAVRKDTELCAKPGNVVPVCSTCRRLHLTNKLSRPKRQRSLAVNGNK
jgi:hypothetical protein